MLRGAEISNARAEVFAPEVRVAIFSSYQDVVGKGVLYTPTCCPADKNVVLLAGYRSVDFSACRGDARRREEQGPIPGITDTTSARRVPFNSCVATVFKIIVEVILDTENDVSMLEIVSGMGAE